MQERDAWGELYGAFWRGNGLWPVSNCFSGSRAQDAAKPHRKQKVSLDVNMS